MNGRARVVEAPPATPLMDVLRNDLGLKGVRTGCRMGECGACTILLQGRPVRSCQERLEGIAEDCDVTTPEGLGTPDAPHPLQRTFLDEQAGQCGYCINGIIMSAVATLEADPCASEEAIQAALEESICRCGTHLRILGAIRRAAGRDGVSPALVTTVTTAPPVATPARLLPPTVESAPTVESWLALESDGTVTVLTGKVELGQGIRTALGQIVASQLELPLDHVTVRRSRSGKAPDESYTSGSQSIEEGGGALAMAARAMRRLLLDRAAVALGVAHDEVTWDPPMISCGAASITLSTLRAQGAVTGPIDPGDVPSWDAFPLGERAERVDLREKLTGAPAYVQDLSLEGLVHARALLAPTLGATTTGIPVELARTMPGVLNVIHEGRFVLILAEREEQAVRAVARLARTVDWDIEEAGLDADTATLLRTGHAETLPLRRDDDVGATLELGRRLAATYSRPYQAHAPMAPSCAVAVADGHELRIWTHTQGIYPLRRELAAYLGTNEEHIVVEFLDGPGCYGHNLADDAAAFAALAARAVPGTPIRFQFSVQDEFAWDPLGTAMSSTLEASIDDDGRIRAWRGRVWTDVHGTRPTGAGDRLMPAWLGNGEIPRPWPGPQPGGARNALPPYEIPALDVVTEQVSGPLRVSALRSLGAFHNVFANESFVDELAEAAGQDPLEYRLAHCGDRRARDVLEAVADRVGWQRHVGPSGRGIGLAASRYKDSKAYVAIAVELAVNTSTADITVHRITMACDAGTIVNPDGLENQLQGGALQGLSRTLQEAVTYQSDGTVTSVDWTSYPVLRFRDVPDMDVMLLNRPGLPPLGAGEAATPPVPAAVANAIDDAVGVRVRDLPITPARIRERLMELTDDEMTRVLV